MGHAVVAVRQLTVSVAFHQISRNALRFPSTLVFLRLDIGGSQLLPWGLAPLSQGLTGVATTLRQLRLGIAYMGIKDPEFVEFCETGLRSLVGLETLSLDASHNWPTTVGVDALPRATHRALRRACLNLGWNYDVRHVCLHHMKCVDTLDLDIANTCMESVHIPDSVTTLVMDMRNVQCDAVFVPPTMRINRNGLRHMTLHLDAPTVGILSALPSSARPAAATLCLNLMLMLDLSDREPMQRALAPITEYDATVVLKMLHLRYVGVTLRESHRFTSTLGSWRSLVWLRLEMYTTLEKSRVHAILSAVTDHLDCLLGFEFTLGDPNTTLCSDTLSPCIRFARPGGSVRNLILDFTGIRLMDLAVALVASTAVLRREYNADHTTTIRVQGSSVGAHGLRVLSSAVSAAGCVFYFHPPMSADVDNIRRMCSSL